MERSDDVVAPVRNSRRKRILYLSLALVLVGALVVAALSASAAGGTAGWTLVGWNNLGMHCMDAKFDVFAILPPYNTIEAQLVDASGNLVKSGGGVTVTYQAVADPTGSKNTTSMGKTDFWQYVQALFGANMAPDMGLAGSNMPGMANTPQAMAFDGTQNLFQATGIPITPYDDSGNKNPYPMMRLTAKNSSGTVLATTDIVLPVSDEMDCALCHASNTVAAAKPAAGWVNDPDTQRDYRLNILRKHDDRFLGTSTYTGALSAKGYNASGLYPTVIQDGKPILCAACHSSEALGTASYPGVPPLTTSVHSLHASTIDPTNGLTLDSSSNRSACYRCHPGSTTRCLRGVMGNSVASDGTMAIQCQNCHGHMSAVGASTRTGWLSEPNCQSCHTGTAVNNNGQIRYASSFDTNGQPRIAVDTTFATTPNVPAAGFSLYRFSSGHGGLQCSSCHGSTHAEFPSSHDNDNIQSTELQGHTGVLVECATCHLSGVSANLGGPHGMHPVGASWVSSHSDVVDQSGRAACQACHGADYRGTVLSRSFADRTINTDGGVKQFWTGFQIGCYTCHNGPSGGDSNPNSAPVVTDVTATTSAGSPVAIALNASDANRDPLVLRVVSQPKNGTAGLSGTTSTYFPYPGFTGTDTFTYAANDGQTDSNLGHVTVTVGGASGCSVACNASAPTSAQVNASVSFTGSATATACSGNLSYSWDFGDGTNASTLSASHTYTAAGAYSWTFTATAGATSCSKSGLINVGGSSCSVTCSATVPSTGNVGQQLSFAGSASTTCTTPLQYQWQFGDGIVASNASATHAYTTSGTFTWTFTATSGTAVCSKTGTVTVGSTSCSVNCSATVPSTGKVSQELSFSGSASTTCTSQLQYQWQFGDGIVASDPSTTHTYTAPGTFTWTFTATSGTVVCSKTGTISVSTAVTPPAISQVSQLSNPFRLKLSGSGIQTGAKVYIASDTKAWSSTQIQSSSSILLSGSGLGAKFPSGVGVNISVVNPDGGSASIKFTRSRQND